MQSTPNLAAIGALIGDSTRALMLETLYDGRAWTASELARAAGVTPQTASAHLARLVDANLLAVDRNGRHRYFRLAGTDVAHALESLSVLATRRTVRPGVRRIRSDPTLEARTCYDHVAGRFGVALVDACLRKGYLAEGDDGYLISASGNDLLRNLEIDIDELRKQRRAFARKCLDWSERRYHIGGSLGAALANVMFARRWIRRIDDTRALSVTRAGKRNLTRLGLM